MTTQQTQPSALALEIFRALKTGGYGQDFNDPNTYEPQAAEIIDTHLRNSGLVKVLKSIDDYCSDGLPVDAHTIRGVVRQALADLKGE